MLIPHVTILLPLATTAHTPHELVWAHGKENGKLKMLRSAPQIHKRRLSRPRKRVKRQGNRSL